MNEYLLAFLTGLTAGGISCMAVQGGLLAGTIDKDATKKTNFIQTLFFLFAKLIAYTIVGFLLGYIGLALMPSIQTQALLQLAIGILLLCIAANLLKLHPFFRYFSFRPPKRILRMSRRASDKPGYLSSAFVGALTVLVPCGVTQAMMFVAIASGSPTSSALIMFFFVLGTVPIFLIFGASITELLKSKSFSYIAAFIVMYFALVSINGAMVLLDSPHTFKNYSVAVKSIIGKENTKVEKDADVNSLGVQEATIFVGSRGYKSDVTKLQKDVPVKLTLKTDNTNGCSRAFVIPSLGISRILPESGTEIIEFTPTEAGKLTYSCSMGMYYGSFEII